MARQTLDCSVGDMDGTLDDQISHITILFGDFSTATVIFHPFTAARLTKPFHCLYKSLVFVLS